MCKIFYLTKLSILQKPVYTAHNTKIVKTNIPAQDLQCKTMKSKRRPHGDADTAMNHIKSFPKVQSHITDVSTNIEYLESHLTVSKMHDLYKEKCINDNIELVKKSMYYHIFSTEFNVGFQVPKKDRYDLCEKFKVSENTETTSEKLREDFERHQVFKKEMRDIGAEEKKKKKCSGITF